MRQYRVDFSTGDLVELNVFGELSKTQAFEEARQVAHGIIDGRPVKFTDSTARVVRAKSREKSTRKMLKNVKLKVPTEAQNI